MKQLFEVRLWRLSAAAMATLMVSSAAVEAQTPQPSVQGAPTRVTLQQAIDLATSHNHALLAARSTILQGRDAEVTANLRPNPVLLGDSQFLPFFQPGNFTADYLQNSAQFDAGVSYLFERGDKRQHRLQAARDQTAVTGAQVDDNQRALTFNVASQYIAALLAQSNLDFAEQSLTDFQQTVNVTQASFNAGATSQSDLLKVTLQLLQFQTDVSSARLARVQALATLRQLLGYESVPENYEVEGMLGHEAITLNEDALKMLALQQRPDLHAAQLGVTAAQSQHALAQANAKRDLTAQFSYTHVAAVNTGSLFANIEVPLFDRNQGEIARTQHAITQSQELSIEQSSIALTDVSNAFEAVRTSEQVLQIYESGYLKQAEDSRNISQYAYQRGSATLLEFLDAQRSYRATQLAYRQALAAFMTALEQLREAVGTRNLP